MIDLKKKASDLSLIFSWRSFSIKDRLTVYVESLTIKAEKYLHFIYFAWKVSMIFFLSLKIPTSTLIQPNPYSRSSAVCTRSRKCEMLHGQGKNCCKNTEWVIFGMSWRYFYSCKAFYRYSQSTFYPQSVLQALPFNM